MRGESMEEILLLDKKSVVIVSPATAAANNGNWHTAARWQQFLQGDFDTEITQHWPLPGSNSSQNFQAMIALHARRSADSIAAWAKTFPDRELIVVLTGTDLYRDIRTDASAQASLALATQLVVLQEAGLDELSAQHRAKTKVIYQSCPRAAPAPKAGSFTALMVGHLRDEKDPLTYLRAAQRLSDRPDIALEHIGNDENSSYPAQIKETSLSNPKYHWLGGLPWPDTLQHMARAQVLVHCSKMEGGAHVILEAVQLGTPVIASRISGNIGMLGAVYAGYFALGDDAALAAMIERAADDANFLPHLQSQCQARAHLFEPSEEKRRLLNLLVNVKAPP
jgi:putative glycosyltransferase (TIGR04348 family)